MWKHIIANEKRGIEDNIKGMKDNLKQKRLSTFFVLLQGN